MALFPCNVGGKVAQIYITGYGSADSGHSPTVDITQYNEIVFILTQGGSSQSILREVTTMSVADFINNGYSATITDGGTNIRQTITYSNGTFTWGNASTTTSGCTIILK